MRTPRAVVHGVAIVLLAVVLSPGLGMLQLSFAPTATPR